MIKKVSLVKQFDLKRKFVQQIVVGNCLQVLKKIPSHTFDMVFADPPYNMQLQNELYRPDNSKVRAVDDAWDQFDGFGQYDEFTISWLTEVKRVLKPSGTLWVIGSYHNIFRIGTALQNLGFWILNDIVWVKSNPMPNFRGVRFTNATETLIWALPSKKAKGYTFHYADMKALNGGKQMRNDWYFSICNSGERLRDSTGVKIHSTQKPLALLERIVLATTAVDDLILDPFAGTCTTGVAAWKHQRNFVMIEQNREYAEWGLKRFQEGTRGRTK